MWHVSHQVSRVPALLRHLSFHVSHQPEQIIYTRALSEESYVSSFHDVTTP